MTKPNQPAEQERILGDLRIFQSVFNDLKMRHEIVTLEDGRKSYAYVYDGIDPYELEDSAFPGTTGAIATHLEAARRELIKEERSHENTIDQRDIAEDYADKLMLAIEKHFNVDFGEHSNINNPWEEALEYLAHLSPKEKK